LAEQAQEQAQAQAQLKRAIMMDDYDRAEQLLSKVAGQLPPSVVTELSVLIAASRSGDAESEARVKALAATKL